MSAASSESSNRQPSGVKLSVELLIIFLLVALIPALVCMWVHRSAWNKILVREILNRNFQVANTVAFQLHESLKTTRKILETTARYPDVRKQDSLILSSVLSTLYQTHNTIFAAIYVIDTQGNQLVNVTNQPEAFSDVSSAVWYRNVVQGTYSNYTSNPFISKATGNPSITMAVLVRGKMYNVEAVLAAEVDLTNLWGMLRSITIGKSGYVYVVDNKGRIICHPREKM
ncbi:MAG: cache domain-containing protein, partial [Gemmatimonadota bacterium]|nr:cache domain-containing protein [Gemmatimonadota bacterium]